MIRRVAYLMLGCTEVDLGEGARGAHPFPPPKMSSGFLKQLVFLKNSYVVYWCWSKTSLYTDVALFFFSFFLKTLESTWATASVEYKEGK